jgi:hypothetical protein
MIVLIRPMTKLDTPVHAATLTIKWLEAILPRKPASAKPRSGREMKMWRIRKRTARTMEVRRRIGVADVGWRGRELIGAEEDIEE